LLYEQAAFGFDLFALFLGERSQRETELARLCFEFAVRFRDFLRRGLAQGSVQLARFTLAPDFQIHRSSGAGLADDAGQVD